VENEVSKLIIDCRSSRESHLPNVGHHVRYRSSNDKVEKPVRRSANRHADASHPEAENLRTNDPRQTGVRKAEAHSEDIDERDSSVAAGCKCTAFSRACDLDVCSNEPL